MKNYVHLRELCHYELQVVVLIVGLVRKTNDILTTENSHLESHLDDGKIQGVC